MKKNFYSILVFYFVFLLLEKGDAVEKSRRFSHFMLNVLK